MIVRYTPSTLLFDERFVDYGCNKVQYIDHLRHKGRNGMRVPCRVQVLYHDECLCDGYCSL